MKRNSISAKVPVFVALTVICLASCGRNPRLNPTNISNAIKVMSLEDKAALLIGGSSSAVNDRLGIPEIKFVNPSADTAEVVFPCNAALAASWDEELIEEVAATAALQLNENSSATVIMAPSVSIIRNPLAGSASDSFSEDPLVSGVAAAAYVNGVQSTGLHAALQGFVAANQTTNAERYDAVASPRALREIYLRGYEIALEGSRPAAVSASSNKINGTWAAASTDLLTTVLREEWGFDGFVTTANTGCESTADMIEAGCDFIAAGSAARVDTLIAAVKSDSISVDVLDRNVERLLSFASGKRGNALFGTSARTEDAKDLARRAAADGIVLLENRYEALPISDSLVENIKLFEITDSVTVISAFAEELAGNGFNIVSSVDSADMAFVIVSRTSEGGDRSADSFELSKEERHLIETSCTECHDEDKYVVVVLNVDAVVETASWKELPDAILFAQNTGSGTAGALADIVTGKVNPSARLAQTMPLAYYDVPSARNFPSQQQAKKNQHSAIPGFAYPGMMTGMFPGMRPGNGAGMQTGNGNGLRDTAKPSSAPYGRYADSTYVRIPRRTRSSSFKMPSAEEIKARGTRNVDYFLYQEGIFVGYRFYDSFNKEVAYPFGYGLSYTEFSYGEADVLVRKHSLRVMIDITNTGSVAGREVVQVYAVAPDGSLDKPSQELRAFVKTAMLEPGETALLAIDIPFRYLASFNESSASWNVDAGTYILKIGASSRDIRSEAAAVIEEPVSYDVHDVLTQNRFLGELHARSSIFRERLRGGMTGFGPAGKPETFDPNAPAPVARETVSDTAAVQK